MEEYKIFDQLNKCKDYEYAFLTTFNFEIGFFERSVLNILLGNDIKKISVFVDQKELTKALNNTDFSSIGKRYMVNPIEMDNSFHPKVILLLGQGGAVLFISSANLTTSGYYINNEIFNQFLFNNDNPETLNIINAAYTFFKTLNKYSYGLDSNLFDECDKLGYIGRKGTADGPILIENTNNSILSQIRDIITGVTRIDIAVPYYDNDLTALTQIRELFPSAITRLFIQNNKCRIGAKKLIEKQCYDNIFLFNDFNEHGTKNFYHGKVFRFVTENESYILYGSANCTGAALLRSFRENGNIECDVLEKGDQSDFDGFFDNFVHDDAPMICEPLKYTGEVITNYHYRYGLIEECIRLYIGYGQKKTIKSISCGEVELKWKYKDNQIVAELPLESTEGLCDVFNIVIEDTDCSTELRCWTINPITLEINRNKELKGEIYKIDLSSDDRFLEDRINIINVLSIGVADEKKKQDIYEIVEPKEQEEDDDEDSDGVVSYVIPQADIIEQYKKYEYVGSMYHSFVTRYINSFSSSTAGKKTGEANTVSYSTPGPYRLATDAEKSFRSFIRTKIRIMNKPEYVGMVSFKHYLFCINVFIEVFDKYLFREHVQDMFSLKYVATSKMNMVNNLLDKRKIEIDPDDEQATILLGVETIIENIIAVEIDTNEDETKDYHMIEQFLEKLENHFLIRDRLSELYDIVISKIETLIPRAQSICSYQRVEQLYGYKTMNQLMDVIRYDYGSYAEIDYDDDMLIIQSKTDAIKDYFKLKGNSYDEIRRYYRKHGKFKKLEIIIENTKESTKGDPVRYVMFKVDVSNGTGARIFERKSGKVDDAEPLKLLYWN